MSICLINAVFEDDHAVLINGINIMKFSVILRFT